MFLGLLAIVAKDLQRAAELVTTVPGLRGPDAVIVASMLNHNVERILSVDPVWDHVPGIRRLDPSTPEFPLP